MELYIKVVAGVLFSLILIVTLTKQSKDLGTVLTVGAGCMVAIAAFHYFSPVLDFINTLQNKTGIDSSFFVILIKSVGIALLGELASLICSDGGSSSMGKVLQIFTSAAMLWLSLPLFQKLLELIDGVLNFR